ncbi:MAG: TetR/AcrR family transcriptional regulator [Actinomycetota bacterium]
MASSPTPDPSTRDRLIAATLELIDERGESKVKVNDVVDRAGTTTGSLYWFLKNRQHLINTALSERYVAHMRSVLESVREIVRTAPDPLALMASIDVDPSEEARVTARRHQIRVLANALDDPELGAEVARVQRELLTIVTELIQDGQRDGQVRADIDAYSVALMIHSMAIGLAVADLAPDLMPDPTKWSEISKNLLRRLGG